MEREYHHEFKNGMEAWIRISPVGMDVNWSDMDAVRRLPQAERDAVKEEYRAFRNESLEDYATRTGIKIAVYEI